MASHSPTYAFQPIVRCAVAAVTLAMLSSCSTTYVALPVDPVLSRDCDRPGMDGKTVRDLAAAFLKRGEAIDECNRRMRAIRESTQKKSDSNE